MKSLVSPWGSGRFGLLLAAAALLFLSGCASGYIHRQTRAGTVCDAGFSTVWKDIEGLEFEVCGGKGEIESSKPSPNAPTITIEQFLDMLRKSGRKGIKTK